MRTMTRILAAVAALAALMTTPAAAHAAATPPPDPAVAAEETGHIVAQPAIDATIVPLMPAKVLQEPAASAPVVGNLSPGVPYPASAVTVEDVNWGMSYHAVVLPNGSWGWVHNGAVALDVEPPRVLDRVAVKPHLREGVGLGVGSALVSILTQSSEIYAYPTTNAPILGAVQVGEVVATSEELVDGTIATLGAVASGEGNAFRYVRVVGRGLEGWALAQRVYVVPTDDDLLASTQPRTVAAPVPVRDLPASVGSEVIATIPAGATVEVGATLVDGWTPVDMDGSVGWVLAADLAAGVEQPGSEPTATDWQDVKDKANDKLDDLRDRLRDGTDTAKDKTKDAAEKAKDAADPLRDVRQWMPVVLIVGGLVVAAALLPRVKRLLPKRGGAR